uniref:TNF receptor-associated factor 2-like isoform X2 n=1 Tax=Pristiophorus japonicus TaxID=55135 RepID=UPI00398E3A94
MVALVSGITPVDPAVSSCLLCSACRFLLIKPRQTECGHRYCAACLENLFKTDNEADCLVCQKKVLRSKVYFDKAAENDAYAIKIQCTAYREGCDWTGSLRNYLDHIMTCGKQKEDCPVCGRADLTKADLEQHCDPRHGTCPNVKVPCPFKEVGCEEQLQRHDLDYHLRTAQQTHLLQMLSLITSLRAGKSSEGDPAGSANEGAPTQMGPAATQPSGQGTGGGERAVSEGPRGADPGVVALAARTDGLEKCVGGLNRDLDKSAQLIELLQQKCLHCEQVLLGLQRKGKTADSAGGPVGSTVPVSTNGVLVWKIKDFSSCLMAAKTEQRPSFYSPAFSTHPFGYKLCCRIYPNGDGNGKGTHVSLFLTIVRGEYDEVLPWPFRQKVTFMLLDQASQRHVKESFSPDVLSGSFQKPRSHMNVASGCPTFAGHDLFLKPQHHYLKNDTIYIKVVIDMAGLSM